MQIWLWVANLLIRDFRDDYERAKDHWLRARMGVYAEGYHQAEEHSRRAAGAAVQLRGLHDALHVSISIIGFQFLWSIIQFGCSFVSSLLIFQGLTEVLLSLISSTERFIICALRSPHMTTRSSCTTNTANRLKSTLLQRWGIFPTTHFQDHLCLLFMMMSEITHKTYNP